jgi:hypothetical protein
VAISLVVGGSADAVGGAAWTLEVVSGKDVCAAPARVLEVASAGEVSGVFVLPAFEPPVVVQLARRPPVTAAMATTL